MRAIRIYEFPSARIPQDGRIVALGFFDGVHIGHRALLSAAREEAIRLGARFSVFTFTAESTALKPNAKRIYTTEEKLAIIESLGADEVILCGFDAVKNISARDFITDCLISALNLGGAVCGKDFRFGAGGAGDTTLLSEVLLSHGLALLILDDVFAGNEKASSTAIRAAIDKGDMERAELLLGAPFFISSKISHGLGLGKQYGIPTINHATTDEKLLPPRGVYASTTEIDGVRYPSVTNIGTCPTFGVREEHAETHLISYSGDLYGKTVRTYLLKRLRCERTFATPAELYRQIDKDISEAIKTNGERKWQEHGQSLR